jgi:hypothetical protein
MITVKVPCEFSIEVEGEDEHLDRARLTAIHRLEAALSFVKRYAAPDLDDFRIGTARIEGPMITSMDAGSSGTCGAAGMAGLVGDTGRTAALHVSDHQLLTFPRPMSVEERLDVVNAIIGRYVHPIMTAKGRDYTEYLVHTEGGVKGIHVTSANANFQGVADLLSSRQGIDKYVTWAVYFVKHIQAILSWVCTRQVKSEPIESRMADAINYVFILWSMLVEDAIVEDPRNLGPKTKEALNGKDVYEGERLPR